MLSNQPWAAGNKASAYSQPGANQPWETLQPLSATTASAGGRQISTLTPGALSESRWITEGQLQSWRPTSAPVERFTGSPSCATSSLDTPRGQCGAVAGWVVWVWLAPHSLPHRSPPLPSPSYAYIEFVAQSSVQAAVEMNESTFRGRVIKVCFPSGLHKFFRRLGG